MYAVGLLQKGAAAVGDAILLGMFRYVDTMLVSALRPSCFRRTVPFSVAACRIWIQMFLVCKRLFCVPQSRVNNSKRMPDQQLD